MKKYSFYIDSSACSGCRTCQVACKDKNDLKPGVSWRRVFGIEGGGWKEEKGAFTEVPFAYNLSMSCFNCEYPKCVSACPTKAIHRNSNGIIIIDHNLCMGCRYCEWVCPYGAPRFDPDLKIMTKCNLCEDYIITGQKPACVDSCPMRALDFGPSEVMQEKYGSTKRIFPLPDPGITEPGIVINPHRSASIAENQNATVHSKEDI